MLSPPDSGSQIGEWLHPQNSIRDGQSIFPWHRPRDVDLKIQKYMPPPHLPQKVVGILVLFEISVVGHGVKDPPQSRGDPVSDHHVDRVMPAGEQEEEDSAEGKDEGCIMQNKQLFRGICNTVVKEIMNMRKTAGFSK